MKKILCILLILTLFFVQIPATVAAGQLTQDHKSESVNVTYSHTTASYVVTIPVDFEFTGKDSVVSGEVNATNVVLNSTDSLVVKVNSTNGWTLNFLNPNDGQTYKFKYAMEYQYDGVSVWRTSAAGDTSPYTVLTVPAGVESKVTPMRFAQLEAAPSTGTYMDTLTFQLSIVPTSLLSSS